MFTSPVFVTAPFPKAEAKSTSSRQPDHRHRLRRTQARQACWIRPERTQCSPRRPRPDPGSHEGPPTAGQASCIVRTPHGQASSLPRQADWRTWRTVQGDLVEGSLQQVVAARPASTILWRRSRAQHDAATLFHCIATESPDHSMGLAWDLHRAPAVSPPLSRRRDEIELGIGIHGEPGYRRGSWKRRRPHRPNSERVRSDLA